MSTLVKKIVVVILFLLALGGLYALLLGFGLIGGGFSIHDTYVVITVLPLGTHTPDQKFPLLVPLFR